MKHLLCVFSGLVMLAGCQGQPKPAASATRPTVLDVTAPRTQHQPSVYALPPAIPASSGAAVASSKVPAYLPPEGSTTSAPPVGMAPAQPPQIAHADAPAKRSDTGMAKKVERRTYLVKRGDTLFEIARDQCGSGSKWRQIAALNPGLTPANLKAGQKLLMP